MNKLPFILAISAMLISCQSNDAEGKTGDASKDGAKQTANADGKKATAKGDKDAKDGKAGKDRKRPSASQKDLKNSLDGTTANLDALSEVAHERKTLMSSKPSATKTPPATALRPPAPKVVDARPLNTHAKAILNALASNNYKALAKDIHPERGVQFSMYAFIDPRLDKKFSRGEWQKLAKSHKTKHAWGKKEDDGKMLTLSVPEYLSQWATVDIFNGIEGTPNQSQAPSSMVNNLRDVYPDNEFIEYYHAGTQWRTLRLIFDNHEGKRYLVAVVSDRG